MMAEKPPDMFEWEYSKENVQPIAKGRNVSDLSTSLMMTEEKTAELKRKKEEFEVAIRSYAGSDPLSIWHQYVSWFVNSHPSGNKAIFDLLEKCIEMFAHDSKYANDERYLAICLQYFDMCSNPQDVISFLQTEGTFSKMAPFYVYVARWYEQRGDIKKANATFEEGTTKGAEPKEKLEEEQRDFHLRVAKRMLGEEVQQEEPDGEQREVLGGLRGFGKKKTVTSLRTGSAKKDHRSGPLGQAETKAQASFAVFSDENADQGGNTQTGMWAELPKRSKVNRENEKKAGVWKNDGKSQKQPTFTQPVAPSFEMYADAPSNQSMRSCHPKTVLNDVPKRLAIHHPSFEGVLEDPPGVKTMYPKKQVYGGLQEFSPEELMAINWFKKQKEKEEREREIKKVALEMIKGVEHRMKKELEDRDLEIARLKSEMAEKKAMPCESSTGTSEDFYMDDSFHASMFDIVEPSHNINKKRISFAPGYLAAVAGAESAREIGCKAPSYDTGLMGCIDQSLMEPSGSNAASEIHMEVSKPAVTVSLTAPESTVSQTAPDSTVSQKATESCMAVSEPEPTVSQTAPESSMAVSEPEPTVTTVPTPDVSTQFSMKKTFMTPQGKMKMSAPSPTVNTAEAQNFIRGLFNQTFDHYKWEKGSEVFEDDEDEESEVEEICGLDGYGMMDKPKSTRTGGTGTEAVQKATIPFIFHQDEEPSLPKPEMDEDEDVPVPMAVASVPFTIHHDEESSLPKPKSDMMDDFPVYRKPLPGIEDDEPAPMTVASAPFTIHHDEESSQPKSKSKIMDDIPVYHKPLPGIEDDDEEILSKPMITDDIEQMDMDDMTFHPKFSSTVNFGNSLRMTSTPFHKDSDGDVEFLPPLSHIKPVQEKKMNVTEITTEKNQFPDTYVHGLLSPIEEGSHESHMTGSSSSSSSAGSTQFSMSSRHDPSMLARSSGKDLVRSKILGREPAEVSPITELSKEWTPGSEKSTLTPGSQVGITSATPPLVPSQTPAHHVPQTPAHYVPQTPAHRVPQTPALHVPQTPGTQLSQSMNVSTFAKLDRFHEKRLSVSIDNFSNYVEIDENMPYLKKNETINVGGSVFTIIKSIGKGGFASVFLVTETDLKTDVCKKKVVKVQKPACPWELYISNEIRERLLKLENPMYNNIMFVEQGVFFNDASCLITELFEHGTLLDLANKMMQINKKFLAKELLVLTLIIELLKILEALRLCRVIHCDFKPDNLMMKSIPTVESVLNCDSNHLNLIDFGLSIDMKMWPPNTTFTPQVTTQDFMCIEMRTKRPWTYQNDLFGFMVTTNVLIFGKYLKVFPTGKDWIASSLPNPRMWQSAAILRKMYADFLNVPSCKEIPDLLPFREQLQEMHTQIKSQVPEADLDSLCKIINKA